MKNNSIWKKKIAGFTLAEVALATTIAMIGTSSALYVQQESLRSDIGRSQGEQLARFANALDLYQREFYFAISNNQPINYKVGTGTVANRLAPTFNDLQGLALVDAASTPVSMFGVDYVFTVSRAPAGCVAGTCVLTSTVHIPTPILEPVTGGVDGVVIGEAMLAGQGLIGTNDPAAPATIRGFRNAWNMPNPIAGNPEGILMAQVSYGATIDAYLRRDGSTPMLGQLNMNGNPITGATTIDATGAVTAGSLTTAGALNAGSATITGNLTGQNASFQNLTLASAAISGNLEVAGTMRAARVEGAGINGTVTAANVVVEGVSTSGQACTTSGQMRRTSTGEILACQSGTFKPLASEGDSGTPWTKDFVGTCRSGGSRFNPLQVCINSDGSVPTLIQRGSSPAFTQGRVIPPGATVVKTVESRSFGDGGTNTFCSAGPIVDINGYADWYHSCETVSNGY